MATCWKKWMKMTLKLDRMTFLNGFQHLLLDIPFPDSIPFLSRFYKRNASGSPREPGNTK